MRVPSHTIKIVIAVGLAATLLGACKSSSDGSDTSTNSSSEDNTTTMSGCNIERPDSTSDEGGPFTDIQTEVLIPCGWPEDQVGVMGKNATYWLSPFNGPNLVPEGTCIFWVYNAQHTTSYVTPTILSESDVTISASYMAADGTNMGFAPGSVTVDNIYQVTPEFILSLRDNENIDLSECGKTTPA
jgi:hypothetical protein